MMPSLPPTSAKKQKNRSIIAIAMAIMLHILIAIIVYFSVFDKKPSSTLGSVSATHRYPILKATEVEPQVLPALTENKKSQATQSSEPISNHNTTSSYKVATDTQRKPINTTVETATQAKTLVNNVQNQAREKNSVVSPTNESSTVSMPGNQNNHADYTLKQTKEYEALDADIDKDNEQLSKLITEVKKRNQSQIQQHQLPNDNINNQPTVEYGYRITPLTAEKESSAIEGSNANR